MEADIEVEAEVEIDAEHYHSSSSDNEVTINIFNGEAEERRRPWDVKKEVCHPQNGQCHPQCPEAIWDRQL